VTSPLKLINSMGREKDTFQVPIHSIDYAKSVDQVPFFSKRSNVLAQALGLERQVDLAYGRALFVSQGGNKNGYYFSRNLLLANYKSVLLKPINIGHNQEFIIGVIYDVSLSKKRNAESSTPEFVSIEDESIEFDSEKGIFSIRGYTGELDVWINFVLYKAIYPGVVETLKENVSGNIDVDKFFISMEIYYKDFMFLWDEDENTAFDRTIGNSYLDSYIGRTVEGKRLYRMYTGPVTFGGGGIVGDPAEVRATIADVAQRDVAHSHRSVVKDGDVYKICGPTDTVGLDKAKDKVKDSNSLNPNKEDQMEIDVSKLTQQISDNVLARMQQLQKEQKLDEASAKIQAQAEEISSLTNKIEDLSAAGDDAVNTSQEALDEAKTKLETAETKIGELEDKIKDLESKQLSEEDVKDLAEYRTRKKVEDRFADLAKRKITVPADKKEEVSEKLKGLTDDQYTAYADALETVGGFKDAASDGDGDDDEGGDGNGDAGDGKADGDGAGGDSKKDDAAAGSDASRKADKVLSDAAKKGAPDASLSQDSAADNTKRGNYFKSLSGLTNRTTERPRGA